MISGCRETSGQSRVVSPKIYEPTSLIDDHTAQPQDASKDHDISLNRLSETGCEIAGEPADLGQTYIPAGAGQSTGLHLFTLLQ